MYEPHEIEISYRYLKTVVSRLEEPICLIGGWAVYHHVNKNFKKRTGRNYIGSREEELGFAPVGFRYLKEFHIETEKELSEDEAKTTPQHFVFPLYIDPVVDIIHPNFYEVFKFNPVDETLLAMVFLDKANRTFHRYWKEQTSSVLPY